MFNVIKKEENNIGLKKYVISIETKEKNSCLKDTLIQKYYWKSRGEAAQWPDSS